MRPGEIFKSLEFRENMLEFNDCLLQEDIEFIANSEMVPWNIFQGKSFLITGATGLIGSQIVKSLICRNLLYNSEIQIYAMVRSLEKAYRMFDGIKARKDVHFICADILGEYEFPENLDYVIHTASMTSSMDFVARPVETIRTAVFGTDEILKKTVSAGLDGFLYLSSLEVYGTPSEGNINISETYSGYIDPLQVRSSYSEGKRMGECLCSSYAAEYKVPVKIARLTQTFGTGVSYNDGRVFAQFARSVIEGKNIVLKTKGETLRSYCYVADAVTALLIILAKGKSGESYNVANENTAIRIADMAKFVCDKFSYGKSRVVFDIVGDSSKLGYNPVMKICLNTTKLKALGWRAYFDLEQMFDRMIRSMVAAKNAFSA